MGVKGHDITKQLEAEGYYPKDKDDLVDRLSLRISHLEDELTLKNNHITDLCMNLAETEQVIAKQAKLIERALEVVREDIEILQFASERADDDCPGLMMTECTCAGCQIQRVSSKQLPKSQALIPALEAARRKVK
jgi:uncharacterized coiled-coil protein SlyX